VAHRLALTTVVATFVLILFGGLVTNTGAALAVPDWPTTFGHNMFLYPWSQMIGGIFYEHSHRLLGAVLGLLTLALAAALWREGGHLRALGIVAVAAVVVQGVLGGLRVVLLKETLAIVHGCLAQAFFGLAVAVFVFVPIVTARLRRTDDAVAAPVARVLVVLLGVQLVLGAGSFVARFTSIWIPGGQVTMLALPVAHRLVGSLILGALVAAAVRVLGAVAKPREQTVSTHPVLRPVRG